MVAVTPGPVERAPETLPERISVRLKKTFGDRSTNRMPAAIALALLCLIFSCASAAVATAGFSPDRDGRCVAANGAERKNRRLSAPCHSAVAISLRLCRHNPGARHQLRTTPDSSHDEWRRMVVIVSFSLLNCNEYLADLAMNGGLGGWTDASYRLAGAVSHYQAHGIGTVDWGYDNSLRTFYGNDLKLFGASEQSRKPSMTDEDRRAFLAEVTAPDFVFIEHTDDKQMFPNINVQLRSAALAIGYTEQVERVVHDYQGRPVFEIFHFVRVRQ